MASRGVTDARDLSLAGVAAKPGEKKTGYLKVAEHPDGSPERIPFILVNGKGNGPTLGLVGGEHGDEVLGSAAVVEFVSTLNPNRVAGRVLAFPSLDSTAFNIRRRFSPIDNFDFSRAWPGFRNGWLAQQVASQFFNVLVEHADYVIDVHDGMPGLAEVTPYIVTGYHNRAEWDASLKDFAESFLIDKIDLWDIGATARGLRDRSLIANLVKRGIPCFVPEIGPGRQAGLDLAIRGFTNTMRYLGMLDGEPQKLPAYQVFPDVIHIFPTRGGVFTSHVELDDAVTQGQKLASIRNFSGEITEELVAPADGVIIAKWILPMIGAGDFSAYEIALYELFKAKWAGVR
jgi:hypothetical protein